MTTRKKVISKEYNTLIDTTEEGESNSQIETIKGVETDEHTSILNTTSDGETDSYTALQDYKSNDPKDLELLKGDEITHVEEIDSKWAIGHNTRSGKTGSFPLSFITYDTSIPASILRYFNKHPIPAIPPTRHNVTIIPAAEPYESSDESDIESDLATRERASARSSKGAFEGAETTTLYTTGEPDNETINSAAVTRERRSSAHRKQTTFTKVKSKFAVDQYGLKTVQDLPQEVINELTDTLERRKQRKRTLFFYRFIIFLCGLFVGAAACGILFALFVYSFKYSYKVAAILTGISFVFILIAISGNRLMKCCLLMILPSLFTSQGRGLVLGAIFVLLVTGPGANISRNTVEISRSMSCLADLIVNQVKALANELIEPILKIADQLKEKFLQIKSAVQSVIGFFTSIIQSVEDFVAKLADIVGKIADAFTSCKDKLESANKDCKSGVAYAKDECQKAVDAALEAIRKAAEAIANAAKKVAGWFGRKRRHIGNISTAVRHRSKRSVCDILDIASGVCDITKVGSAFCEAISFVTGGLESAANTVKEWLNKAWKEFEFGVDSAFTLTGDVNSTKSASQIVNEVITDITSKISSITNVSGIISNVLSITILILFLNSLCYMSMYLKKDYYDNKYISPEFREYDYSCKKNGKETVLPLKYKEHSKYIITSLPFPTRQEYALAGTGLSTLATHFGLAVIVIGFNYLLYYLLDLMSQYGQVAILSSSLNLLTVTVEGSGIIAIFLRTFIQNLDLDTNVTINFNITECLPNPTAPTESDIPVFTLLYGAVLVIVIMQMFSLRIRRIITAHYYPEREAERVRFLHEKIRHQRKTFFSWISQYILFRKNDADDRITIRGMLSYKSPRCMKPILDFFLPPLKKCLSCDEESTGNMTFHKCKTCNSLYCSNCYEQFKDNCIWCKTKAKLEKESLQKKFDDPSKATTTKHR